MSSASLSRTPSGRPLVPIAFWTRTLDSHLFTEMAEPPKREMIQGRHGEYLCTYVSPNRFAYTNKTTDRSISLHIVCVSMACCIDGNMGYVLHAGRRGRANNGDALHQRYRIETARLAKLIQTCRRVTGSIPSFF